MTEQQQTPISRQPEGPIQPTHPRATEVANLPQAAGNSAPPVTFTAEEILTDPILQFFTYAHLPERLQHVSAIFARAASQVILVCPRTAERTVALRKLLEAKDAAVRAVVSAQV